jgi:hypothetical protein
VFGGDGNHCFESKLIKFTGFGVQALNVGFIRRNDHTLARRSKQRNKLFIKGSDSLSDIHHPDQDLRLCNCGLGLLENVLRNNCIVVRHHPTGVHQRKAFTIPIRYAVNAVPSDSRLVADNRAPFPGQSIKKG